MRKHRPTVKQIVQRLEARYTILQAANANRGLDLAPLAMRNLNEAVFKCRQRGLVSGDVLAAAGYRPKRRSN